MHPLLMSGCWLPYASVLVIDCAYASFTNVRMLAFLAHLDCDGSHDVCVLFNFAESGRMAESDNWSPQQPPQEHTDNNTMSISKKEKLGFGDVLCHSSGIDNVHCMVTLPMDMHSMRESLSPIKLRVRGRMVENEYQTPLQPLQADLGYGNALTWVMVATKNGYALFTDPCMLAGQCGKWKDGRESELLTLSNLHWQPTQGTQDVEYCKRRLLHIDP
ncbi:hypothetical protein Tco_0931404 [Tanacetum coccineum]